MKRFLYLSIACSIVTAAPAATAQVATLPSGEVSLNLDKLDEGGYAISVNGYGVDINKGLERNPAVVVEASLKTFYPAYTSYNLDKESGRLVCVSEFTATPSTTVFRVEDTYASKGNGEFELDRNVTVTELGDNPYSDGFYTSFGLQQSENNALLDYDYFIPGVWYKANFEPAGNLPKGLPTADDTEFCYREDRTPLPVVMMRHKESGLTSILIHKDSKCETVLNDTKSVATDAGYQFGGIGVIKRSRTNGFASVVTFPGSDLRTGGMGVRRHPIAKGFDKHHYKVYFKVEKSDDYADAVADAWNLAFDLYNPQIREEDLKHAYDALLETCAKYYLAPNRPAPYNGVYGPGFPWGVQLRDFSMNKNTYEIGFVGAQTIAGYALFRAGLESGNADWQRYGNAVLNFWAQNGLTEKGLPKSRYAALNGTWDSWAKTALRQACTGMQGLLNAWCYAKKNGIDRQKWLTACLKFGDFLVEMQNPDGSYYMEYDPFSVVNGKHPAGNQNKYLTACALRYLVELYIATGDEAYRTAAEAAAEYSWKNIHEKYRYVACVIDNPQTIDSESGQQAINGFLAMYDLTKEPRWLEAAEQAATYEETWTFMFDVPVESDQTGVTDWPRDRSIVGQHLIAIGHSACDLGFAWSSFVYYRLYLLTGKEHYLQVARICAHNTKQSMNLGQKLYPGQAEGLQQEAFQIKSNPGNPRRMNSVMEALTWNFAAHLDPMMRFKDAFGTVDLEEVEKMPKEEVMKMNERYSLLQSSDYGQEVGAVETVTADRGVEIRNGMICFNPDIHGALDSLNIFDVNGRNVVAIDRTISEPEEISIEPLEKGFYVLELNYESGYRSVMKICGF